MKILKAVLFLVGVLSVTVSTASGTNHMRRPPTTQPPLEQQLPPPRASAPQLASLTLAPTSVTGGTAAQGTVALSAPAPSGGAVVNLSTSNAEVGYIGHPGNVATIPAGATTLTFYVWTKPVAANPNVIPPGVSLTITASPATGLTGAARTASLTVLTPGLKDFGVNPFNPHGGQNAGGWVQLTGPAPTGGAVVSLSSSNAALATVPSTVTVPAGQHQHTFTVPTYPTATGGGVDFTAQRSAFDVKKAHIEVLPPALAGVICPAPPVVGGTYVACRAALVGRVAPGASVVVTLSSSQPELVAAPASVTVPSGADNQTFEAVTRPVASPASATISGSYHGATKTTVVNVSPPAVQSVSLTPTSLQGGFPATGTVRLTGEAPSPAGVTVQLSSSKPEVTGVPQSVTVSRGSRTASFPVTTEDVTTLTLVTISASSGGAAQTARLTLRPAR